MGQSEPVPVSACFQPKTMSSGALIGLELRFHIHMPYFSQAASINGSAQALVLKISGFQSNPSEALCSAASNGCGARRDPRGSNAAPTLAGSRAPSGRSRGLRRGGSRLPPRCSGSCPAGPVLWWRGRAAAPLPPGLGAQKLSETVVFPCLWGPM